MNKIHKNGETNGFKIDTDSLRKAIATNDEYYPTELSTDGIDLEGNGTKIILSNLKKKRTAALATHLRQRLARRFAIIGAKNQFKVLINDNEIVISDRNYLSKAQCVWVFPPKNQPDETSKYFGILPQTGQLKWIIPALLIVGFGCIGIGIQLLKKENKSE